MPRAGSDKSNTTRPIVVVPLGSWEQHGPHLPPDTDSAIIHAVVSRACIGADWLTVAPVLHLTASDEHRGFSNTLSMGTEALSAALVSIARSADWARGVVFANGHGGNSDALRSAAAAMTHEKLVHAMWSLPAYEGSDMHAGRTETSVMLHIRPDDVDMSRARPGASGEAADLVEQMRKDGVRGVSANGVLGDPSAATAEHGAAVVRMWAESLRRTLDQLHAEWD